VSSAYDAWRELVGDADWLVISPVPVSEEVALEMVMRKTGVVADPDEVVIKVILDCVRPYVLDVRRFERYLDL